MPMQLPKHLTLTNANAVVEVIQHGIGACQDKIIAVDLSPVTYCDSAGIACLIEGQIIAQQSAQHLHYQNPSQQLRELATFLKVAELLFAEPQIDSDK